MGELLATKEGHKRVGKGQKPFVKGLQCGFAGDRIADQNHHKIEEVVLPKARTGEAHLLLNLFQGSRMLQNLSKGGDFSHPARGRRPGCGGNLDSDR